jgi:DNA mismatch endonuclease, patch repair protein
MAKIGSKNTAPEILVRRLLHALGYRFRLHARDLPGTPDIVFRRRKKAIFVHGCFWHAHGCKIGQPPKSRLEYWLPKLEANRRRDEAKQAELVARGWEVLIVWQCQTKDPSGLVGILTDFLKKHDADQLNDAASRRLEPS